MHRMTKHAVDEDGGDVQVEVEALHASLAQELNEYSIIIGLVH